MEKLPQASESSEVIMEFMCRRNVENCVKSATKEKEISFFLIENIPLC